MKQRFAILFSLTLTILLVGCGTSKDNLANTTTAESSTQIVLEQSVYTDQNDIDFNGMDEMDTDSNIGSSSSENSMSDSAESNTNSQSHVKNTQNGTSHTATDSISQTAYKDSSMNNDEWVEIECVHADTSGQFYISTLEWTETETGRFWTCTQCGASAKDGESARGTIWVKKSSTIKETDMSPQNPANCKHFVLVEGVWYDAFEFTTEDPENADYNIFTCSRCGTTERRFHYKLPNELIVEAFKTGKRPSQIKDEDMQCVEVIRSVYNSLPENADDFDKIYTAAQWLYNNCVYDHENYEKGLAFIPDSCFSYYGPFLNGVAVCEGYMEAFGLLMDCFGVRNLPVIGNVSHTNLLHAWNLVYLDGSWYHIDTTWGSNYFLLSENEIKKDHVSMSYEGYATTPLPEKYLKRLYNVPDENVLSSDEDYISVFHQNVLAGKNNHTYLIKQGTKEISTDVFVFNDYNYTEEEKEILRNYIWSLNGTRRYIEREGYVVLTLTKKS